MNKLILALVLIWAAVLRTYNNTAVSLWHDEAFSALYLRYNWGEMMHRIVLDVHPPLYYIILRFWSYLFGESLLSLRGMSIVFGVLTVWMGYLFVKKAFNNNRYALLAAFFLAINPFQIQYALEARMYTLGTFFVMLAGWFMLRALESKNKKEWIGFALAAAAGFYTHYYVAFSILAMGLYGLYHVLSTGNWKNPIKDNQLVNLVWASILSLVFYLPWIPSLLEQIARVQGGYWIGPMDNWAIPGTIWKMAMGGGGINRPTLAIATVIAISLTVYLIRAYRERAKWLVVLSVVVPFASAILLSMVNDIYLDRYFVFASTFFSVLIALAFAAIPKAGIRNTLVILFACISLAAFWQNWQDMDVKEFGSSFNKKPGMAGAAAYLNEQAGPDDKIYFGSSLIFFTFKYYNETGIQPELMSGSTLNGIPHYSGTAIMTEDDLVLNDYVFNRDNYDRNQIIWLVWTTGWGGSKPNVPGNWTNINELSWQDAPGFKGQVYITQYRVQ
jgi:uncharacterized membrane protein